MQVTQVSIGRFHHFHLARQLHSRGLLKTLWTGYPRHSLRDETNLPQDKLRTFPWLQAPYMVNARTGLVKWEWLNRQWSWLAHNTLDRHVASTLRAQGILIALSGSGLQSGKQMLSIGGKYICDRGSTHIQHQQCILAAEFARWGVPFLGVDPRMICKELQEYELADAITVPSEFVRRTFLDAGIPAEKIHKIPYGANLTRFRRTREAPSEEFTLLWVGTVSLRKGFLDALHAFRKLRHPRKAFIVIGKVSPHMDTLLRNENTTGVKFIRSVPNSELPSFYSSAHAFILPSLEEGLAMVQGEAMACGCPVIATPNAGAEDLFEHEKEGYIVPPRAPDLLHDRLECLANNRDLQKQMSAAAVSRVCSLGGWHTYGEGVAALVRNMTSDQRSDGSC